jgi:hypothetical protein
MDSSFFIDLILALLAHSSIFTIHNAQQISHPLLLLLILRIAAKITAAAAAAAAAAR